VREQNHAGGKVTREFACKWVDFEIHEEAHDPMHTMFATPKAYLDYWLDADEPDVPALAKLSPLAGKVYRSVFTTGSGSHAADELRKASRDPWLQLRLSRLIVKHESEWANPGKWKQLYEWIEQRTEHDPAHEEELKRIAKLVWWDAVTGKIEGFPASADVFHIHPVGLVGNFRHNGRLNVTKFVEIYKRQHSEDFAWYDGHPPVRTALSPLNAKSEDNLRALLTSIDRNYIEGTTDFVPQYVAYMLATARVESYDFRNGIFFGPVEEQISYEKAEYQYGCGADAKNSERAKKNNNTEIGDGYKYRGRGLVQITWKQNYEKFTSIIGIDLVANPQAALPLDHAVKIMVSGMLNGTFTGHKLSSYISKANADYVGARRIINGTDRAEVIANYARKFEAILQESI
jgi:hypothetical protein